MTRLILSLLLVSTGLLRADELKELEAEMTEKLKEVEAPILKEYCEKLERLQAENKDALTVSPELILAKTRLEAVEMARGSLLPGSAPSPPRPALRALPISGPSASLGEEAESHAVLLLPRQAKLSGRLELSPDQRTITHWNGGDASWTIRKLEAGMWHLFVEYGKVACGQDAYTLTISLGEQETEVALQRLRATGNWNRYSATHVAVFEIEEDAEDIDLSLSCKKGTAPELLHLRHVLLRPQSSLPALKSEGVEKADL